MKKLLLAFIVSMMIFQVSALAAINGKSVKSFVERFYVTVLDREADIPGLMDWTNNLTTGISAGSDVATGFVFSAEFINRDTSDIEFLNILYHAFFNRTADAGGLAGWLDQLTQGTSREEVLNGFLYSQEFSTLAAAYGIKAVPDGSNSSTDRSVEEFVSRFYSVVLGRTADAGGLADWVNRLNTKVATGADIATGFVFSSEFDEKSKDDVTFLNVLYSAFFNRTADQNGISNWAVLLKEGMSREDVLVGFLHSDEFVNLCDNYTIIAYSDSLQNKLSELVIGKTFYYKDIDYLKRVYFNSNTTVTFTTEGWDGFAKDIISVGKYSIENNKIIIEFEDSSNVNGVTYQTWTLYDIQDEYIQFLFRDYYIMDKLYYQRKYPDNAITDASSTYELLVNKTFYQYCHLDNTWKFIPIYFGDDKNILIGNGNNTYTKYYKIDINRALYIENVDVLLGFDIYTLNMTMNGIPQYQNNQGVGLSLSSEEDYLLALNEGSDFYTYNGKYGINLCNSDICEKPVPEGFYMFENVLGGSIANKNNCNNTYYFSELIARNLTDTLETVSDEILMWSECAKVCHIYYNSNQGKLPILPQF